MGAQGNLEAHSAAISRLCGRLDLIHVVDILSNQPAKLGEISYVRLHGLGGREVNYKYRYSDQDLGTLSRKIRLMAAEGVEEVYVLFNNISMKEDSARFLAVFHQVT